MIKEEIAVSGKDGLHARPAGEFVQLCKKIKSSVKLERDGKAVPGNSIIGIMSLGVSKGEAVTVLVDGEDEAEAMSRIKELLDKE